MTNLRSRMRPARLPLAVVAFGLVFGALAEREAAQGNIWSTTMVVVDSTGGVITLLAGLAVWWTRRESRLGPVITIMGVAWFAGAFGYSRDQDLVDFVGFPLQGWQDVALVALVLLFPSGRLGSRAAAVILGGVVASHLVLSLARLLLRVPYDPSSCFCVPNRILPVTDPAIYNTVDRVVSVAEAGFAIAALVLVVGRWRAATGPARRTLGWVAVAGALAAALISYNRLSTRLLAEWLQTGATMQLVLDLVRMSIPLAASMVLVRGRRSRARAADLVVGLSQKGLLDSRAGLRKALADPTVQLLRWSAELQAYEDEDGRPVPLPDGVVRAVTELEADGVRLGALIHDPALREEPELLTAVAAAARMALHNERLTDEVRVQLEEVQASRRRLVEVADAERRRLERDLHDGAQQYLVGLVLKAGQAERRAERTGDPELARQLVDLAGYARSAQEELRALARGIRPPVLTEAGLGPALHGLADRFPLPVELDVTIGDRLGDVLEATAYFAAAEALTNILKYAEARSVRLTAACTGGALELIVADDGRGGATPGSGTGLLGLADRLQALAGSLEIDSPPAGGTTLVARIPLAGGPSQDGQRVEVARR